MLVLTEAAAEAVKALTATPQAPEGSGLRIASSTPEPTDPALTLTLRLCPTPGRPGRPRVNAVSALR